MPVMDLLPKEIDRALYGLAQTEAFQDSRPALRRLFGVPRFTWETGWIGKRSAYVRIAGWPPGLLTQALAHLSSQFVVTRSEAGLLDRRRHNPFMIVLISGRKADA